MKRIFDILALLCCLTLLSSNIIFSQSVDSKTISFVEEIDTTQLLLLLQEEVLKHIEEKHISPPKIDDVFSTILFSNWIDIIDPDKIFLYEEEISQLSRFLYDLDDQLNKNDLTFFEQSREYILEGVKRNLDVFEELQDSNIDFTISEEYNIAKDFTTYIKTDQELEQRYIRYAKYNILEIFNGFLNEAAQEKSIQLISRDSLLTSAKQEFYNRERGKFNVLRIKDKINYFEDYLDAIVQSFDPYCAYYSEIEKQDYDVELTGKEVGIGVFIVNEHGQHQVEQIVIGGPAWRTEKIEIGDIILGATLQDGEYHGFEDATIVEVASIIRGRVGTSLTVHFLDGDSIQKDVKIYREEILSYGEQVKGLILSRQQSSKVGYIDIRKFYNSLSIGKNGSSAEDVISYLKHFENNNIKSLIIDMRDCVGGILDESLSIIGALIGKGPILQTRDRKNRISIYQSESKKPVYTGNIIVLTNQNSASAAEILASSLQDYKRAIVIGSRTYGKGSVQTFENLKDEALTDLPGSNDYGWLKYTFMKYYRVNGDATQLVGVSPDIVLPSILDSVAVTENTKKNALLWSQIEPTDYEEFTILGNKLRTINIMSKIRVASNLSFKNVKEVAIELQELYAQTSVPLNLSDYRSYEFLKNEKLRNASNVPYSDNPLMQVTTVSVQRRFSLSAEESRWMGLRSQDIYINEALNILDDLVSLH